MLNSLTILTTLLTAFIEGVVVSDCASTNMETCSNISSNIVALTESLSTVYVQSEDGRGGHKYTFETPYSNNLHFGDRVRISVAEGHTTFEVIEHNVRVPLKLKHIAELTDEDLYTFVTLEGLEFCKKEGSYLNINEKTVQISEVNKYIAQDGMLGTPSASENADAWATMLRDDRGSNIYCIINSTCPWRRDGRGVPQGIGRVSGILVPGDLERYGNSLGKYAIRPVDASAFAFPSVQASSYEDVCAWRWNFNKYAQMDFEKAGSKRFVRPGEVIGDRLKAESGQGVLYTDTGASMSLDDEFDARHPFDGWKAARMTGSRSYAALRLDAKCGDFYSNAGKKGIYVETSTLGIEKKKLQLYFSFVSSREHSKYAENYPLHWQISYSIDGVTYTEIPESVTLCPMIFQNIVHGGNRAVVHNGCVPGFTEHCIALPDEVCGKEKLIIRISPSSDRTAILPSTFDGQWRNGNARNCAEHPVIIRFGDIVLSYLKH